MTIPAADSLQAEIFTAALADFPFESFMEEAGALKAYIPAEGLAGCKDEVDAVLREAGVDGHRYIFIEAVNWNAVWESNFEPVDVAGLCRIRAPFHDPAPEGVMDVVIMPKMSFGTGHHSTTYLMSQAVMEYDVAGKRGLDMGSGTGVLAIIAAMRGAAFMDAVDIDEWAFGNSRENIAANGVEGCVESIKGDACAISGRTYDFILANINLNILLKDMPRYAAVLRSGGGIFFSGILHSDVPALEKCAGDNGLEIAGCSLREGWACVSAKKI